MIFGSLRMGLYRFNDHGVVYYAIDQSLPLCKLKWSDSDVQTRADFIDHTIDSPPQKPADTGNQKSIQQRPTGNQKQ